MATIDINQYIEQSGMRKARFGGYEPDDVRQAMLDLCSDYEQRLNTAAQQVRGAQQEAEALRRRCQTLIGQNQNLATQNASLAGKADRIARMQSDMETRYSKVQERNHSLTDQVAMLRLKNTDLELKNKELTERAENADAALRIKGREHDQAKQQVLAERDSVVAGAQKEAARIRSQAREEADQLLKDTNLKAEAIDQLAREQAIGQARKMVQAATEETREIQNAHRLRLQDLQSRIDAMEQQRAKLMDFLAKMIAELQETQDYVKRTVLASLADLPHGEWETTDYLNADPAKGEGLVPIRIKLRIDSEGIHYDLRGSAPAVSTFLNSGYGTTHSAIYAGTKTFFPEVPLNSGFYAAVTAEIGEEGTVVNAGWPNAVTGFCSGPYEKVMNGIFELWSQVMPERAMACAFNLEYLLIGGHDGRTSGNDYFMWYDWMAGGWGGRGTKDGSSATSPVFGTGLAVQPVEGQERLNPVLTTSHAINTDSGGPGRFRGGCGVEKGGVLTDAVRTVMSYCCDRGRSVTWGIEGGLPSVPHGVWLNKGTEEETYLGATFSNVPIKSGDAFTRPSAGGGGFGDPLEREPEAVLEDVIDGYVSIRRAERDYGVVIEAIDPELDEYRIDEAATAEAREEIRTNREAWLGEDAEAVAEKYRSGEIDQHDALRRHGVILDWGTGELLEKTTAQYRETMERRSRAHWS